MKRLLLLLCMLALLSACQRSNGGATTEAGAEVTLEPLSTPPTPVVGEEDGPLGFSIGGGGAEATPEVPGETSGEVPGEPDAQSPGFAARFSDLRFATSGNGVPQVNFPEGTEEIYAIWNYDGMSASDTMERLWYHNGEVYVERREQWDYTKYGSIGAVRDVYLYDYIDGIDPGEWRVEIYLNGEQQLVEEFTVGGP